MASHEAQRDQSPQSVDRNYLQSHSDLASASAETAATAIERDSNNACVVVTCHHIAPLAAGMVVSLH